MVMICGFSSRLWLALLVLHSPHHPQHASAPALSSCLVPIAAPGGSEASLPSISYTGLGLRLLLLAALCPSVTSVA